MALGFSVFSPISQSHPIAEVCDLPTGWEYWEALDRAYLGCCRRVVVLRLEGWEQSVGVTSELRIAKELAMPVTYVDP